MFYFAYIGNKRTEIKQIEELIDLSKYKRICEPFCGSSAFSYDAYKKGFKGEIYLNDNDTTLYKFYTMIKKDGCKPFFDYINEKLEGIDRAKHKELCNNKDNNIYDWFFYNKIYNYRKGLFAEGMRLNKKDHKKYKLYDEMIQSKKTKIFNLDFKDFIKKVDKKDTLFILDPPYLDSFNSYYQSYETNAGRYQEDGEINDNTELFLDVKNLMGSIKGHMLLYINNNAIMKEVYKDYFKKEYKKKYSYTKKNQKKENMKSWTQHGIYANF